MTDGYRLREDGNVCLSCGSISTMSLFIMSANEIEALLQGQKLCCKAAVQKM